MKRSISEMSSLLTLRGHDVWRMNSRQIKELYESTVTPDFNRTFASFNRVLEEHFNKGDWFIMKEVNEDDFWIASNCVICGDKERVNKIGYCVHCYVEYYLN
ncbi:MAG: hypothetical protein GY679_01170 [Mycoplasma sp.]|nr:hypothetical protein [Mycoplasma sp.]